MKELATILTTEILQAIGNNKNIRIAQLNAIISLLIKSGATFSLSHTPQTRSSPAETTITIDISPNVAVTLTFGFSTGELLNR